MSNDCICLVQVQGRAERLSHLLRGPSMDELFDGAEPCEPPISPLLEEAARSGYPVRFAMRGRTLSIVLETRRDPPIKAVEVLVAAYPDLLFRLSWAEPGTCDFGRWTWRPGAAGPEIDPLEDPERALRVAGWDFYADIRLNTILMSMERGLDPGYLPLLSGFARGRAGESRSRQRSSRV